MRESSSIKVIALYGSIVFASGVLFANMYNSIVDTAAWGRNIPESILTTRNYYQSVNPGTFFVGLVTVTKAIYRFYSRHYQAGALAGKYVVGRLSIYPQMN